MGRDVGWKGYFSDDERYADIINGIGCKGRQVVKKEDLKELDTQTGFLHGPKFIWRLSAGEKGRVKIRDCVRKAAFGMNFAIIGIENQETIDYSIPLRSMSYDVGTYEKQAVKIRKEVRKNHTGLNRGEYLYGFARDSRMYPAVTFVLYSGAESWNGPETLHEMLDFTDIPEELKEMVADYRVNLIDIRKLEDTSVFQTDVRQVFNFIRCSGDKNALKDLVEQDEYYKCMEADAFEVAVQYTNATELIEVKEYYEEGGSVNMCQALTELIADGRMEGRAEGRAEGRMEGIEAFILDNMEERIPEDRIIKKLQRRFHLTEEEAKTYFEKYALVEH